MAPKTGSGFDSSAVDALKIAFSAMTASGAGGYIAANSGGGGGTGAIGDSSSGLLKIMAGLRDFNDSSMKVSDIRRPTIFPSSVEKENRDVPKTSGEVW